MAGKLTRSIELTTNIAIITVAILLSIVLVKNYLLPGKGPDANSPNSALNAPPTIPAGTKLALQDVNWAEKKHTLVMVLSDTCRFCTESADFYKRIAQEKAKHADARMIAVLPQDVAAGQAYLNKLGVSVDEVRQSPLNVVGVRGTPTLILVDDKGVVTASWVGKLPAEKEVEVLNRFLVSEAAQLHDSR